MNVFARTAQARQAVGGLLGHLQHADGGAALTVTSLEPHKMDNVMKISPETFLALNIFDDKMHPSCHGGRSKESECAESAVAGV